MRIIAIFQDRWITSIAEFEHLLDFVAGDALVCAAGVAFNGAFTAGIRDELMTSYKSACVANGIKLTEGVTLTLGLSQPHEVNRKKLFSFPHLQIVESKNFVHIVRLL